jgi:hypothetical protein
MHGCTTASQRDGARADFFVTLGAQIVKQNIDWESKYKIVSGRALGDNTSIIDVVIPTAATVTKEQQHKNDKFIE